MRGVWVTAWVLLHLCLVALMPGSTLAMHHIHASASALKILAEAASAHATNPGWWQPTLTRSELMDVFDQTWRDIRDVCPSLPLRHSVDVDFDDRLLNPNDDKYKYVIGFAKRNDYLSGGVWRSALASQHGYNYVASNGYTFMGEVRIARSPPGGWFRGSGDCSVKFRLEDVLRHEIMHLVGVSSTIRESSTDPNVLLVGRPYMGVCMPGEFDRLIHNVRNETVVGVNCRFSGNLGKEPFYVNNVQLFQYQDDFVSGTSMSHLRSVHAMLTPSVGLCESGGPRPVTTLDADVLQGLHITCDPTKLLAAADGTFTDPNFLVVRPHMGQNGSEYSSPTQKKSEGISRRSYSSAALHLGTWLSLYLLATTSAC